MKTNNGKDWQLGKSGPNSQLEPSNLLWVTAMTLKMTAQKFIFFNLENVVEAVRGSTGMYFIWKKEKILKFA